MENKPNIPCSICDLWDSNKKSFQCNPHKCQRLSGWLEKHALQENAQLCLQYIV